MKQFVAVASLLGLASAEPFYGYGGYASSLTHGYAPAAIRTYAAPAVVAAPAVRTIAAAPVVAAAPVTTTYAAQPAIAQNVATVKAVPANVHAQQYHAQDEFGNYEYGYDNPNSQKKEGGNARGVVQGHFITKDLYGARRTDYIADAAGFRVVGKRDADADAEAYYYGGYGGYGTGALTYGQGYAAARTYGYAAPAIRSYAAPAVVAAPAVRTIAAAPAVVAAPAPVAVAAPVTTTYAAEPVVAQAVASVKAVPANVHAQQYHAQDEFGNFEFGYDNPNSQRKESGNALTGVRGHYTTKDAFGIPRRVDYVADGAGFRATKNFY